jgi:hypothetical protein
MSLCACGCGREVVPNPSAPRKKYCSRLCSQRAWRDKHYPQSLAASRNYKERLRNQEKERRDWQAEIKKYVEPGTHRYLARSEP